MSKPKIRFNGFTEDWEQRKLGEIVERVTRKNQDLVSELPLTISAQYGLIDQNEFFDKRVASRLRQRRFGSCVTLQEAGS